jgi:hypothetical protein
LGSPQTVIEQVVGATIELEQVVCQPVLPLETLIYDNFCRFTVGS